MATSHGSNAVGLICTACTVLMMGGLTCMAVHHVHKFGEVIPTGSGVISRNALNFGPFFEFLLLRLKNCWEIADDHISLMSCVGKPWLFSNTCKNSGGSTA